MGKIQNNEEQNKALERLGAGMYILTSADGERKDGCIVSSVFAVSHDPLTLAVSVNNESRTLMTVNKSGRFALCILSELSDPYYIARFGFQSGDDNDKFVKTECDIYDGVPVVKDTCGYFICKVDDTVKTKTHSVIIGSVEKSGVFDNGAPMTYAYYKKTIGGMTPEKSPLYTEPPKAENIGRRYYDPNFGRKH